MTNDIESKVEISNCKSCTGYMIIKKSKKYSGRKVYGCTNYIEDGTGCNECVYLNNVK